MSESSFSTSPGRDKVWEFLTVRIAPILGVLYQFLAIAGLATVAIRAVSFYNSPFIGSFVEHTLVINSADSVRSGTWNAKNAGLDFGNQIVAIDGHPISNVNHFHEVIRKYSVGQVSPNGYSVCHRFDLPWLWIVGAEFAPL